MRKYPYHGPIPWSSVERMAHVRGYDLDEFTRCVREMDRVVLEFANSDPDKPKINKSRTFGPADMKKIGK